MYPFQPPAIYLHESVCKIPAALARAERMLAQIDGPEPVVVDDAQLDELSHANRWDASGVRLGQLKRTGDPALIFNTFRWRTPQEAQEAAARYPHLRRGYLLGTGEWTYRDGRATRKTQLGVCQNAWELHSAWGCLHRCDYCDVGNFLNLVVNLEEFVERLEGLVRENAWCRLYKYDNHTDTITFEPEYGASELLVRFFARQAAPTGPDGSYLMLYTKSANVDHLLELDHRGHTIICWSLSPDTVSRLVEKNSASTSERIGAAQRCQQAGYHVRMRFSPFVPVQGWREESEVMIEELLTRVQPDLLTMDTFKWLEPRVIGDILDLNLWDDEFRGYVEQYAAMEPSQRPAPIIPQGKQVFPHEARARVYRFLLEQVRRYAPKIPVSLCGETPQMWEELAAELRMSPEQYVCTCGPDSVPGNPLLQQ
jgi:spore photoproduct lyase